MKRIALFSAALLISACAHEMPKGEAFESTDQLKLNSASHWDVLAQHEADMIKQTLSASSLPVFIQEPKAGFPFARAYHHLLTSRLAEKGVQVVTRPDLNAATISYVVDVVEHSPRYRENRALATPLAQGVYYLAGTYLAKGAYDVTTTAMEIVKSPFYAFGNQVAPGFSTSVEVVITTQIIKERRVLNSDSRVYYVDKGNLAHYSHQAPIPLPHRFTLTDR
ncbi:MAG: hypothetical protein Q7U38_20000 [Methylobacter sp.]|nr:hypothetical protein [Methylobacter sp.]MDP2099144.1 hypothetical protein [Methylobacter sp.]MDP2429970.1 hypothetical protein [Methylobacter sp.]MDP3054815.1 hypothetical protein [Methylobacter sp.]MDP3361201.1 hypothetical protein [Methylobacter sp.]